MERVFVMFRVADGPANVMQQRRSIEHVPFVGTQFVQRIQLIEQLQGELANVPGKANGWSRAWKISLWARAV